MVSKDIIQVKRNFYKFFDIKFDSERVILLSKIYSKILENRLRDLNPDLIFTCDTYSVSFIRTNKPIYIWTDATFKIIIIIILDHLKYKKHSMMVIY